MMIPDGRNLAPYRALDPGADGYAPPPVGGAAEIAERVLAGSSTVLVGGPAGIGKSTELAQAAHLLQGRRRTVLLQLDRTENMRHLSPDLLLSRIAGCTEEAAPGEQVVLLIDGLDKVPQGPAALELFGALGGCAMALVVVIPWHAIFGPGTEQVIRHGEHLVLLRPPEVREASAPGRAFLRQILAQRLSVPMQADGQLSLPQEAIDIVGGASGWSGGMPRIFLQLMADAGLYARMQCKDGWPGRAEFSNAVADYQDIFRRALLPGDTAAIRAAEGTDGRELDLARKMRLMAHGILIERLRGRQPVLEIHPLAVTAVLEGSAIKTKQLDPTTRRR